MRRLVAIVLAAACAACVLAGVSFALPTQTDVDPDLEYGYVVSGSKSESVDFAAAASHDNTYYLFGSSELATVPSLVSTAPDNVLRDYDCGYQFMYIGDAYDQSLWMAIAAGAHDAAMPNRKIGMIVSPQWFVDEGLEPGIFKMRFSYPLYEEFCSNPSISDETKRYVARRLNDEGVDQAMIDAGVGSLPQDAVDGVAFDAMADMKLRHALDEVRVLGSYLPRGTEPPDFAALRRQALAEAEEICSSNDFAVNADYWAEYIEPVLEERAGEMAGETLSGQSEYDDFRCFLDVCHECGLDPYIVIPPANGFWYDYVGLDASARSSCYERIRSMCDEAGVTYLDLSVHEYDSYYLRDIMHLGWLGWLDVEQGFMDFAAEDRGEMR